MTVSSVSLLPAVVEFDTVPWWLPVTLVTIGLLLYGAPQVNSFLGTHLPEWRHLPSGVRAPIVGILVAGAGLIVFAQLAQFDWMYVLFLFGYARAVEGATILHLFGRLDEAMRVVFDDDQDQLGGTRDNRAAASGPAAAIVRRLPLVSLGSKVGTVTWWFVGRLLKRVPLLIVTGIITTLSVALMGVVLVGFPEVPLTVRIAGVVTVMTLALSTVSSAWVFTKVTDELAPWEFVGVVCCVVGGELYNLPSVAGLFPGFPAVGGPFGAWTVVIVGFIGWTVGVLLAVTFFVHRKRRTRP